MFAIIHLLATFIADLFKPVVPENSTQPDSRGEGVSAHHPK
jgi:hypothetical protein